MNDSLLGILEAVERLESRVNTYWNFYTIVVLAAGGWFIGGSHRVSTGDRVAIAVALIGFIFANLSILVAAVRRIGAFEDELQARVTEVSLQSQQLRKVLSRPSLRWRVSGTVIVHLVIDVALLYVLYARSG